MLQLHNTLDPDSNIPSSQIIFGRHQKRHTFLRQLAGEILKSKCMPILVPSMGYQGASALFTDLSRHRVSKRMPTTTMAISPWRKNVSPERAGHQPQQMGQIRDCLRIPRPQSVLGKGRCLWYHPHHLALSTPLYCHHHCPTFLWNQAHTLRCP